MTEGEEGGHKDPPPKKKKKKKKKKKDSILFPGATNQARGIFEYSPRLREKICY